MTPPFTPTSSTANMTLSSTSIVAPHNNTADRDEWEAMFDPQYTHMRRIRKDTSPGPSPADTPTLPRIDHVKVQAPCPDQIDILPCPSASFAKQQRNEARMGLLQTIREQGLSNRHDTWKDQQEPQRGWQERLHEKIDEDDNSKQSGEKPTCRRSFLYFAFGFLFPPLWIVGALYVPPQRQHPGSQTVDLLWKRRSRNAFFIFIVTVLVILILTLVLRPASIGWRTSNSMRPSVDKSY
ncbi:hypothetical protein BJV82DRAFT_675276 [Fennellomyces sp. T-0311]|nr:hypothetical protein BJV82DRAFT_675276 [Fennellomyces sp. T-0311]